MLLLNPTKLNRKYHDARTRTSGMATSLNTSNKKNSSPLSPRPPVTAQKIPAGTPGAFVNSPKFSVFMACNTGTPTKSRYLV